MTANTGAAPARKPTSLAAWRKRTAGWRKVNAGEVKAADGERVEFHWLTPSGRDLIELQSVAGGAGSAGAGGAGSGSAGGEVVVSAADLDRICEFLASVLCDAKGEREFADAAELHESGFGDLEYMQVYMEMFTRIAEAANSAKKKPKPAG